MGKSFHARQKTASFTANKDGRKRQTSSSRRNIHNFRQSSSRKCVQFRCKVCMKNFASDYYLNMHHRKEQCKKRMPSLISAIEYIAVETEEHHEFLIPPDSPETFSPGNSNSNTYICVLVYIFWTCVFISNLSSLYT